MKGQYLPLNMVSPGRKVKLVAVRGGQGIRRRLNDMGLSIGVEFRIIHSHFFGPCIIAVDDTRLILGRGMSHKILVEDTS
ncbi:ferrous iron transport protein A [bacterium]|nr:ferrous iron transport protein A [bacterium]